MRRSNVVPGFRRSFFPNLSCLIITATQPHHTHLHKMAALTTIASEPTATSDAAVSGFRLGEGHLSDPSDSDQSAHSEGSLSPSRSDAKKSKSKKRRELRQERRQVGALTDELGTLLGAAFQTLNNDALDAGACATSGM